MNRLKRFFYSNGFLKKIWVSGGKAYENLTKPTGIVRSFVVFPLMGFMRIHKLFGAEKPYDEIEKLRGIHAGKRCFIVATGPSLRMSDLELINNEITISMNQIYKCYSSTSWRPNYYMSGDYIGLFDLLDEGELLDTEQLAKDKCIIVKQCKKAIRKSEKLVLINMNWLNHWNNVKSRLFKYNPNLLYGFYDFYTITNSCIQMAMYMGIKEIYLLGVDCNYSGGKNHAYEADEAELPEDVSCMIAGYQEMKKIAEQYDVHIYNATRGGKLEVFERVNFEEIINR